MRSNARIETNFIKWFFRGSGGDAGYCQVIHKRLIIDLVAGSLCAYFIGKPLDVVGATVLLPLAAVLVGIVFAWSGSAQSLLQSDEMSELSQYTPGGLSDYVFGFQVAILLILTACLAWGVAGLSAFEPLLPKHHPDLYFAIKIFLYGLISMSVRESWSMVTISQGMILMRAALQQKIKTNSALPISPVSVETPKIEQSVNPAVEQVVVRRFHASSVNTPPPVLEKVNLV